MTQTDDSLRDHFLVASPYLEDAGFHGAVVYLCEHSAEGAMGIVVNQPLEITVGEVLDQLDIRRERPDQPVYAGGPVQTERGFVLHRTGGDWHGTMPVSDRISLTVSRDVLEAIGRGDGPRQYLMALGYSGWGEGQLEEELASNSWLVTPADDDLLFRTPDESRYAGVLRAMGIDLNQLTNTVGHA
ncbi:hypothetical protein CF392_11670 [Tamilnaduibacter salinus]|uniref:UPF0301 protein CF392_11670 n=1 Tax=Tamilnaduibacter salinus TaxID=1484056 RepID=A0A2A2I137_9GAMM|nr:YqgE/AlgH family protein [Tamilnaduibacter salinus]PAV25322.1 hypothetical protein CF392_11670 [Tamilnaduibacter salinus]